MAAGGVRPYVSVLDHEQEVCDESYVKEPPAEGAGIFHFRLNGKKGNRYIERYKLKPVKFTSYGEVDMDMLSYYLNNYSERLRNEGDAIPDSHAEFINLAKSQAEDLSLYTGQRCNYSDILILAIQKDEENTIDFYMLEDGVVLKDTDSDSLANDFDYSCCMTGSGNTYIVIDNDKKFKKYLESQIVYCKDHTVPAMEAVRTGRQEYKVGDSTYSMYKHGENYVQVRNNREMRKVQGCKHNNEKLRGTPRWGKAHINGTGSDSLLIYVRQQYAKFKVVRVVGILDHKEAGISDYSGSYQARRQHVRQADVESEWDKVIKYVTENNARVDRLLAKSYEVKPP